MNAIGIRKTVKGEEKEMSSAIGTEMKTVPLTVLVNEDAQKVGEALSNVLADTFTLYLKTHNFHWNVTWRLFPHFRNYSFN